jgi:hypothetical protein
MWESGWDRSCELVLRVRGRSDELNGLGEQRYVLLRWMIIFEHK